jgi:arylsulfatase
LLAVSIATLPATLFAQAKKPNILVIFGDDIGQTNISAYGLGVVGYRTPNIDRIAKEGMMFTDYYAENSCTAGRSSFITGRPRSGPECRRSEYRAHPWACRRVT